MNISALLGNRESLSIGEHMWSVVLAGGTGTRLRGLTRYLYGEERPKQYAALIDGKSLLRQTLDRSRLRISSERTIVVTMKGQGAYMTAELKHDPDAPNVLEQPADRGTAAAILLAAHWIRARDPKAVMVMLPSDHFVSDDEAFMGRVGEALQACERRAGQIVLLGAEPSEAETDYGWIDLGKPLADPDVAPIYGVRRFVEKPDRATAKELWEGGALWNTFVFAGGVAALVEAGRECLPLLHDRLFQLDRFFGTEHERWAIGQAYEFAPRASFSRALLERCPTKLAVMRLTDLTWCDLGTPRRVVEMFDRLGVTPDWLSSLHEVS